MTAPLYTETLRALLVPLSPLECAIEDESAKHAGHSGSRPGGNTHFRIRMVSAAFRGKPRVARHRLVYQALAEPLKGPVHALALELYAPEEKSL